MDCLRRKNRKRSLHIGEVATDRRSLKEHPELVKALAELSEEHRLALMVYYFDERNARAVAEVSDISKDEAIARLSRARKQLRQLLQGGGDV
jgi:RNA polymerase sigma-70 factor (ECF subfamily)